MKIEGKNDSRVRISLEKSQKLTENWQKDNLIKGFLFHKNELSCVSQVADGEKIRFYMGLNGPRVEMVVVAVNQYGEDIIDESINSMVYNFALPCPSTCDITSPLFHSNAGIAKKMEQQETLFQHKKTCVEWLQEIPFSAAFQWTLDWQRAHVIKSFLFDLDQLQDAMKEVSVSRIRVYFGREGNLVFAIMIGVNDQGFDIPTPLLQVNMPSPCGVGYFLGTKCDEKSPLFHVI